MSPQCDPQTAFVVCGPVSAGNRLTAAVLIRGGCSGEATAFHEWEYNNRMPEGPDIDPLPCIIRHNPFCDYPSINDKLLASGYLPKYIYVVRDLTANTASVLRQGHSLLKTPSNVIRQNLYGMLKSDNFEVFPVESLMLNGNKAAAALCARHGLKTNTQDPIIVDRVERDFNNTDWKYFELSWFGDHGFYPVNPADWPYDDNYFNKYVDYANTSIGKELTQFRVDLVRKYFDESSPLLDFGIGCGSFIEAFGNALGYDINYAAVKWLKDRNIYMDPWPDDVAIDAVTFWDSLEHVLEIDKLLSRINKFAFISMPIFKNYDDVISSHHFRINEHYWYFTRHGFINYMDKRGFRLVYDNNMETKLGRHSINTFVFMRAAA